jgi:FkbM family methyltransferase
MILPRQQPSTFLRGAIGLAMRVYRRSPLHPRLGRTLGRLLAMFPSSPGPVLGVFDGVTFELDLREVIDSSLYYSGTFEADAERAITSLLQPGMLAIDVGANIGYHTFRMAKAVGESGRVWAIEPMASAMRKLRRNCALNSFPNIEPIKVGLSDVDQGATEIAFQSSYRLDGTVPIEKETVEVRTLDSLIRVRSPARLDFIKVDVDGFEGKVFRGASRTLEKYRPRIFFEISPWHMQRVGDDSRTLIAGLRALGYRFETEDRKLVADVDALCARIPVRCSINLLAFPDSV